MQKIRSLLKFSVLALVLIGVAYILVDQYSYIFTTRVHGEVVAIERVTQPSAILGAAAVNSDVLFSFAMEVRDSKGEIFTASSNDRQWAVVKKGDCIDVVYYPYPPWNLEKAGTFFNARLKKIVSCDQLPKS